MLPRLCKPHGCNRRRTARTLNDLVYSRLVSTGTSACASCARDVELGAGRQTKHFTHIKVHRLVRDDTSKFLRKSGSKRRSQRFCCPPCSPAQQPRIPCLLEHVMHVPGAGPVHHRKNLQAGLYQPNIHNVCAHCTKGQRNVHEAKYHLAYGLARGGAARLVLHERGNVVERERDGRVIVQQERVAGGGVVVHHQLLHSAQYLRALMSQ